MREDVSNQNRGERVRRERERERGGEKERV